MRVEVWIEYVNGLIFRNNIIETHRARSSGGIAAIIGEMCQKKMPPTA
jgi:hypothetical protein